MITEQNQYIWNWIKCNWPRGGKFYLYSDGHLRSINDVSRVNGFGFVAVLKIKPKL